MTDKDYSKTNVLIVGAGPAGLAAGIKIKIENPNLEVCIIDKGAEPGNHNLSGAVLEINALKTLLDQASPGWEETKAAKNVLGTPIEDDDMMLFMGDTFSLNVISAIKLAKIFHLGFGQMIHKGDYSVSISQLCSWLSGIAKEKGVEVLTGFAAEEIILAEDHRVEGIKLVDHGRDHERNRQPNFVEGEYIKADFVLLAEGADGLITEKFIKRAGLKRKNPQLYSVGVKELIRVSDEQYEQFGANRVVHAMGYPLWSPLAGPDMFGGGIMYAGEKNHISVAIIVGVDWKYYDFSPQQALANFKKHKFVRTYIENGTIVEAGAKMIPEGGLSSIPRAENGEIGKNNCMILGDGAGFVNMLKIKGLHNAIESGILSAQAILENTRQPSKAAGHYTELVDHGNIGKEMRSAKNYRQMIAKFGLLMGAPLSSLGKILPYLDVEDDSRALKHVNYKYKPEKDFDRDTFVAMAGTGHREEQPNHVQILNPDICIQECRENYEIPCLTFCPAGVYEIINGKLKAANPSNCLHCKCCQRKCPYHNVLWTVPEGSDGPRYKRM
ncbi:MAG: electron-transfer flavoprotein:ubiquinone oxidoreductase [Balneolales bacterium]